MARPARSHHHGHVCISDVQREINQEFRGNLIERTPPLVPKKEQEQPVSTATSGFSLLWKRSRNAIEYSPLPSRGTRTPFLPRVISPGRHTWPEGHRALQCAPWGCRPGILSSPTAGSARAPTSTSFSAIARCQRPWKRRIAPGLRLSSNCEDRTRLYGAEVISMADNFTTNTNIAARAGIRPITTGRLTSISLLEIFLALASVVVRTVAPSKVDQAVPWDSQLRGKRRSLCGCGRHLCIGQTKRADIVL